MHRFKPEVKDFIFHVVAFSIETFQILLWKFLLCFVQKVFGVYIFPNFVLLQHIVVQKQVKNKKQPPEVSLRKGVPRNFKKFTGKHLCQSLHFNKVAGLACKLACNFIKIETLTQVFSCEFSEISKNTIFKEIWLGNCFYKTYPRRVFAFCLFYFQVACNCKLIKTRS